MRCTPKEVGTKDRARQHDMDIRLIIICNNGFDDGFCNTASADDELTSLLALASLLALLALLVLMTQPNLKSQNLHH